MGAAKRKKIDLDLVRDYRARGVTYAKIGASMGFDPSSVWRALNQPGRGEDEVPAGKHRSAYLPDEHWELLRRWGLVSGDSRAVVMARLIEQEAERRGIPLESPKEEAA